MLIHIIELENMPIYKQLQIEEALLRTSNKNYCLINKGSPLSIVMGISSKIEDVLFPHPIHAKKIPVVRRFSGGGTVIVDSNTIFVSFIFQQDLLNLPLYPEPLLRWTEQFYKQALKIEGFHLKENDYVIHNRKCGGNAQYIQKQRFVHHTTFLWDFCKDSMEYLKIPKKIPQYRKGRCHTDFLCRLKKHHSKNFFIQSIVKELEKTFSLRKIPQQETFPFLSKDHRKSTQKVTLFLNKKPAC